MMPHKFILLCYLVSQATSFSPSLSTKPIPRCDNHYCPASSTRPAGCEDNPVSVSWGQRPGIGDPDRIERRRTAATALRASPFAVPASSLEQDLSKDERTTVRVVRAAGPSVAYVTSLLLAPSSTQNNSTGFQSRRSGRRDNGGDGSNSNGNNALPYRGQPLGSGSGFVVDAAGYLCTNFHVVEAAYTIQQAEKTQREQIEAFWGNVSSLAGFPRSSPGGRDCRGANRKVSGGGNAQVYVRIDSQTRYRPCRIVDVVPDLDVAVLKIENDSSEEATGSDTDTFKTLSFGSSGGLLVGQQLIAIGNPFGLDNTVTTGVVSALNREIQVGGSGGRSLLMMPRRTTIRNCIQTDCAINPGNSGGPLLNRQGNVIGMNTAIVTTSGSSAGIGFAVPSDLIQPAVQRIIRADQQRLRPSAFLGVQIVKFQSMMGGEDGGGASRTKVSPLAGRNWILSVEPGSPAAATGMKSLRIDDATGRVEYGDAIVAVGGNSVPTFAELQAEIDRRKAGEQVQVTLEDKLGNRRVVYLTLAGTSGK